MGPDFVYFESGQQNLALDRRPGPVSGKVGFAKGERQRVRYTDLFEQGVEKADRD